MSSAIFLIVSAGLAILGYVVREYGLPPPTPKIVGIDLGTTFSSIGIYQAVTGRTDIVADHLGKKSIPSVVAFLPNGTVLIGSEAVEQQEKNPLRTIYDAKRFIGKNLREDDKVFQAAKERYPFTIKLENNGSAFFEVPLNGGIKKITPEEVGHIVIDYLKKGVEKAYNTRIVQAVIAVPAEFDEGERNATRRAAELAGLEVRRVISEPTAAALAYGLDKKQGVEYILVVDLGGGTMDVSILYLQSGVFMTLAMAGNNRLGGQDFNDRLLKHLIKLIEKENNAIVTDKEDIQQLRLVCESAKIQLSAVPETIVDLYLQSLGKHFRYRLTRKEFEGLNEDLFEKIVEPIQAALQDANIKPSDIDEIVLVGGSTRIPRVRSVVGTFFGKAPNYGIDPELAVVTGASVQAGVIGGGWPLQVTAIELPTQRRKLHIYNDKSPNN